MRGRDWRPQSIAARIGCIRVLSSAAVWIAARSVNLGHEAAGKVGVTRSGSDEFQTGGHDIEQFGHFIAHAVGLPPGIRARTGIQVSGSSRPLGHFSTSP